MKIDEVRDWDSDIGSANVATGLADEVTDKKGELGSVLSSESASLSVSKLLEKSDLAKDVFEIKDGILIAKRPKDSEVMKGHLGCNLPIVPGVVWLDLFMSQYGEDKGFSIEFLRPVLPGYKVVYINNEFHKYNDESRYGEDSKIVNFRVLDNDDEFNLSTPINMSAVVKNVEQMKSSDSNNDGYLLQEGKFRFVENSTQKKDAVSGDEFYGFWEVPVDLQWTKDGKVMPAIIVESAAQTGASFLGSTINKGDVLRRGDQLNLDASLLTLGSSFHKSTGIQLEPGDTVYVHAKITECCNTSVDEKNAKNSALKKLNKKLVNDAGNKKLNSQASVLKKEIDAMQVSSTFEYYVFNQHREEIMRGQAQGDTRKVSFLRMVVDRAIRDAKIRGENFG